MIVVERRNKKLIVKQRDLKDCGVCCIEYLILYYKGYVPLEKLRVDAYVTKEGTTAYHLVETLKTYHFQSYGMRSTFSELKELVLPAILHFQYENGLKHFVVLLKIKKKGVLLMDPAKGKTTLDFESFSKVWTGVVIVAFPNSEIPKFSKEHHLLIQMKEFLGQEKNWFFFLIGISILWTVFSILLNFYSKLVLESSFSSMHSFFILTLYFGCVTLFKLFLESYRESLKNILNRNLETKFILSFLTHILKLPIMQYNNHTKGEFLTRIRESEMIQSGVVDFFTTIFIDGSLALSAFFLVFLIQKKIAYLFLIGGIIYVIVGCLTGKYFSSLVRTMMREEEQWNTSLTESLELFLTMKHLNQTNFMTNRIESFTCKYFQNHYLISEKIRKLHFGKQFIVECLLFLSTSCGLYFVLNHELSIYSFLLIQGVFFQILEPLEKITNFLPSLYYIKGLFAKIGEFQDLQEEVCDNRSEIFHNGNLCCTNLSYSYNGFQKILRDQSFLIRKGSWTLFVGPSGCGKSTICKLLQRQFENFQGSITIGDKNILDYSLSTIRSNITYLSQKESLMNGTIRENILFGRTVLEEEFDKVCDICALEEIVCKRPFRYNDFIFVDDCNLSGGERQRIFLARTLLNSAQIYLLDECLSEVNPELEKRILEKMKQYFTHETIVYISHNPLKEYFDEVIQIGP